MHKDSHRDSTEKPESVQRITGQIMYIIREQLFPVLGIPDEVYQKGISNIPTNLREIYGELYKAQLELNEQTQILEEITRKTNERIVEDIPTLFKDDNTTTTAN